MSNLSDLFKIAENVHKEDAFSKSLSKPSKNKEMPKLKWTKQQEIFLNSSSQRMVLTALAGTGKSSLLMEYAKRNPHKKWNFIAFNKSVIENLKLVAPPNVVLKTAHKMAFEKFGHDLHSKLEKDNSPDHLLSLLSLKKNRANKQYIKTIESGLKNYIYSSQKEINFNLCDEIAWRELTKIYPDDCWDEKKWTLDLQEVWRQSLNPQSPLGIDHDVYLKRFSMQEDLWMGDYWMLDEGQDWSEAFLDAWSRCAKNSIRAGDPYQRLYEWRGASSSRWIRDEKEREFWLTHSHRTGYGLEDLVNKYLLKLSCPQKWQGNKNFKCQLVEDKEVSSNIKKFSPNVILSSQWDDLKEISQVCIDAGIDIHWPVDSPYYTKKTISSNSILLTTVYRAKGLEFDRVWISDNIYPKYQTDEEKSKIAYVAITRAKNMLRVPSNWNCSNSKIQRAF